MHKIRLPWKATKLKWSPIHVQRLAIVVTQEPYIHTEIMCVSVKPLVHKVHESSVQLHVLMFGISYCYVKSMFHKPE